MQCGPIEAPLLRVNGKGRISHAATAQFGHTRCGMETMLGGICAKISAKVVLRIRPPQLIESASQDNVQRRREDPV